MNKVQRLVSANPVVIFSISSCCMCHTIKRLFHELAVFSKVCELDEDPIGNEIQAALFQLRRRNPTVPMVFIGGELVGSNQEVIQLHVQGKLVPMLRAAGAIFV